MRPLTLAIFALFAGACGPRDAARDAGDSVRSLVRVDLSYTQASGIVRFEAQAHFVRYRAFDPAAVPTILGFTDFTGIPLDACRVSEGTAELDEALDVRSYGEVALLDAGRIDVRGPSDRALLRPSHYPELVPFVSGVVYGGDDTHPVALGVGQPYQVSGGGGEEVGPFAAQVTAPRAFAVLRAEPLRRGDALDLRWSGEPESPEPLLVEVKWASRAGARAVRCRVKDDGELTIPRDLLDGVLAGATLTSSRVARAPLVAPGAGKGELAVELRNVTPLQVVQ